jgi:(p)ppGpp synthase/HD superfamily hydrolase
MVNKMFLKAIALATEYHAGQVDKAGKPYVLHPLAVAQKAQTLDEQVVALLHDMVEDTAYTEEMLRYDFPKVIADAVMALTRMEGETYADFVLRAKANPLARKVKMYDMEHNMSDRGVKIPDSLMKRYKKGYAVLKG